MKNTKQTKRVNLIPVEKKELSEITAGGGRGHFCCTIFDLGRRHNCFRIYGGNRRC